MISSATQRYELPTLAVVARRPCQSQANRQIRPSHLLHMFYLEQMEYRSASCLTYSSRAILFATSIRGRTRTREPS